MDWGYVAIYAWGMFFVLILSIVLLFMMVYRREIKNGPNWEYVSHNCYEVRNQRGLNNALYHCVGYDGLAKGKKEIREMLQNWPKSYPCKLTFIDQSFSCGRVYVEVLS